MNKEFDKDEPILNEANSRYCIYPIDEEYRDCFELYLIARAAYWLDTEPDYELDIKNWDNMVVDERTFIEYIMAFFAQSDGIVNENLATQFMNEVKIPEANFFYGIQYSMECIHNLTYSKFINTYIKDETKKKQLFNAIETMPVIKLKAEWAKQWMDKEKNSFAERLIGFAVVEGIFFSGSFCSIFWLKKRGLMPGFTFANELISRDEGLHRDFAITLYSHLKHKLSGERILQIIRSGMEVEEYFIRESLKVELIGMSAHLMIQYVQSVADHLLVMLGQPKYYKIENPFDWMENISLDGKTNFFERRVSEYAKRKMDFSKIIWSSGEIDNKFYQNNPILSPITTTTTKIHRNNILIDEKDIELVQSQTNVTYDLAMKTLQEMNGDIVNAIMVYI